MNKIWFYSFCDVVHVKGEKKMCSIQASDKEMQIQIAVIVHFVFYSLAPVDEK